MAFRVFCFSPLFCLAYFIQPFGSLVAPKTNKDWAIDMMRSWYKDSKINKDFDHNHDTLCISSSGGAKMCKGRTSRLVSFEESAAY